MNEWIMILALALGGILFAAGGTHIPKIGGQKWIRRFVLATALGGIAAWSGIEWWRCVGLGAGLCGAFHLPYGSKSPYWMKTITAICFVLPTMFIGFSLWQVFTPAAFLAMFWLSNNRFFASLFPWKVVEFLTGAYIATTVVQLINQTYR
jgi:hypothetical protein